jgi:hypothetical protein
MGNERHLAAPATTTWLLLQPLAVAKFLAGIAAVLLVLHSIGMYLLRVRLVKSQTVQTIALFFDVGEEASVPTIFSVFLLLFAALLLLLTGYGKGQNPLTRSERKYWWFLGFVILFLSVDEGISIHEWVAYMIKIVTTYNFSGYLYYPWVIPYFLLAAGVFLFVRNFLFRLPARTRTLFIASGALFVGAAVGLEMVEALYDTYSGTTKDLVYGILFTIEEALEMSAIILFIYALLTYLSRPENAVAVGVARQLPD